MKKVQDYIKRNKNLFILKENISDEEILNAEKKLGFKFDDNYLKYLKQFGFIAFESIEIFGLGVNEKSHLNALKNTIEIMNSDKEFPQNAITLEYIGEGNYIIYIMDKGVYQYSSNSLSKITDSLEEYLLMHFEEIQ